MKRTLGLGLAIALLSAAIPVSATTFYFDDTNSLSGLVDLDGPWASVTLTDISSGGLDGVHFVVDPIDTAFVLEPGSANFGLQTFYFNENTGFGSTLAVTNFDPMAWTYSYTAFDENAGGGFGKFEFSTAGSGSSRANPLVFDVFAPSGQSLSIEDLSTVLSTDDYLFAGHIAGYGDEGEDSAKFATHGPPIPEPGTLLLLGSGLLGLGLMRRRKADR